MGFGIWNGMGLGFGTNLGLEWVWDLEFGVGWDGMGF